MANRLTKLLNSPEFCKLVNLLGIKGEGEGNGNNKVNAEIMGMPMGE